MTSNRFVLRTWFGGLRCDILVRVLLTRIYQVGSSFSRVLVGY